MTEFAKEYGEGLYSLAVEEDLSKELLDQLNALKQIFRHEPDFLRLLSNKALPNSERVSIIDNALKGEVHSYLLNFIKILCERGALNEFEGCVASFQNQYNEDHKVFLAVVTSATPLKDKQRENLIAKLRSETGHDISLVEKVDPSLLGGLQLEMNGKRFDNSIRSRLESLKKSISADA